ncbi:coiled-coil domain-containing protein 152-like [Lampris incognitus]|uniref:coiled-coil domain-containing protein 152-like n=1 Tax=Lampris incognitus TaxID=2546036 RepID=UPI0024B61D58|nr:coiled-coil domain-containing protein 152-like [Lampris incognitus]
MSSLIRVDTDKLTNSFRQLEKKIVDIKDMNDIMEDKMNDSARVLRWSQTRERSLVQERDGILATVNSLQQCLQEQCNLRDVNEKLKNEIAERDQQIERTLEEQKEYSLPFQHALIPNSSNTAACQCWWTSGDLSAFCSQDQEAKVAGLLAQIDAEEERHQWELTRQQSKRKSDDSHNQTLSQLEEKDAEVKKLLERKESELDAMREKFLNQEKERQSDLLRMQIEFGAKLSKVQSMAQRNQQPQSSSPFLHIYKRKLLSFQEEKNKEIDVLRQRIKELEERQRAISLSENCSKRRRV